VNVLVEFTVEPFVEGVPGEHVLAALSAVRAAGFEPEVGPFGSSISGELRDVSHAVARMIEAATAHGASRVSVQVTTTGSGPTD
jgi:uncharacterized protein YqgV (UPF0045/DUF77 family)